MPPIVCEIRNRPPLHAETYHAVITPASEQENYMTHRIVSSDRAPRAIGPYAQARQCGPILFLSGQLPIDPKSGMMPASVEAQTEQCMTNIAAIIDEAHMTMDDIVSATVLLDNIRDFDAMNAVYARFFSNDIVPSRVAFAVSNLPREALVEIEVIAMSSET